MVEQREKGYLCTVLKAECIGAAGLLVCISILKLITVVKSYSGSHNHSFVVCNVLQRDIIKKSRSVYFF